MNGILGGIFDDFRHAFRKRDNSLVQIIVINVIVFIALNTLGVLLWLTEVSAFRPSQCVVGSGDIFCVILQFLELPADTLKFITRPWTLFTYFFTQPGLFPYSVEYVVTIRVW